MTTPSLLVAPAGGQPASVVTLGNALVEGPYIPAGTLAMLSNGSAMVVFTANVTLPTGTPLVFASQPYAPAPGSLGATTGNPSNPLTGGYPTVPAQGSILGGAQQPAVYTVASPGVVSGMSVNLTTAYTGPTPSAPTGVVSPPVPGTSQTFLALGVMPGNVYTIGQTVGVTQGSVGIDFSAPITLPQYTALVFSSDPSSVYYLAEAIVDSVSGFLSQPYAGPNDISATVQNVTQIVTVEQDVAPVFVNPKGQRIATKVQPFGSETHPPAFFFPPGVGQLGATGCVVYAVDQANPVMLVGVPANMLIP